MTNLGRAAAFTAAAAAAFTYGYRHWHMRWGATDEEVHLPMPGDDLIPNASFTPTRAVTWRRLPRTSGPGWFRSASGEPGGPAPGMASPADRPR